MVLESTTWAWSKGIDGGLKGLARAARRPLSTMGGAVSVEEEVDLKRMGREGVVERNDVMGVTDGQRCEIRTRR